LSISRIVGIAGVGPAGGKFFEFSFTAVAAGFSFATIGVRAISLQSIAIGFRPGLS
jgi:hypothetical protein